MARPKKNIEIEMELPDPTAQEAAQDGNPTLFTEAQVKEMIRRAVDDALAQHAARPQVVSVAADIEKVHFLWQAEVSDDNVFSVGPNGMYGRIVGRSGSFYVPKNELSRVMDAKFRYFLEKRWIIVVSGLNAEEREAFGVEYRDGEILDKRAFAKMVEMGDAILPIYPKLCEGHRKMVAKRYYEAYMNKNPHVRRDVVARLNQMSGGDFDGIIERMNEADRVSREN